MGTKRKDGLDPYWRDEKDWLCTVDILPTDDPEPRFYRADIIGYVVGYAHRILNAVSFDFDEVLGCFRVSSDSPRISPVSRPRRRTPKPAIESGGTGLG